MNLGCSIPATVREMPIKTTMNYNHTPIRMGKIEKKIMTTPKAGEDAEQLDHLGIAGENIKWCSHSEQQFGSLLTS